MASNALFVGIDGCGAGWLAASMSREMKPEFGVFSDADDFWRAYRDAAIVLVDIPIALRCSLGTFPTFKKCATWR